MSVFVPDASATLAWCFKDEASDWTRALLARFKAGDTSIVPQHWPIEVANSILVAVRRKRITPEEKIRLFDDLVSFPIHIDLPLRETTFSEVFLCAEKYGLTVYDAAYLELAIREGIALATLDSDLRKAALSAGVSLA